MAGRLGIPGLFIGVAALGIAAWKGLNGTDEATITHFFHSYLAAYSFFMAITLGSIAFILIHYLTRAGWSVTVRRLAEGLSLNMFLMVLLVLPLVAIRAGGANGVYWLFHWFRPGAFDHDDVLIAKHGYLNPQFFAIRMGIYFLAWCLLAWFYSAKSAEQDRSGNPRITVNLEKLAAPCIIFFGFSLTAFVFDWIMSLNPHWFSTIFGVYYFAGAMLSVFSTIVLLSLALQKRGLIGNAVTHEHYHDLGKWMFAFTFFWGYIAFSQYMLIWYANLPEETQFFIPRQIGQWGSISILLLLVHLLIPFPGLLSRHAKRRNTILAFWAVWSLCACALDQFWLVIPNEWINKIPAAVGNPEMPLPNALPQLVESTHNIYTVSAEHQAFNSVINFPLQPGNLVLTVLCFVGIGGLYIFSTMLALKNKALVPVKDPRVSDSLAFENI
jgi:hypothetical protein